MAIRDNYPGGKSLTITLKKFKFQKLLAKLTSFFKMQKNKSTKRYPFRKNAPKNIVIMWEIVQNAHKRYNYPVGKSLTITLKK